MNKETQQLLQSIVDNFSSYARSGESLVISKQGLAYTYFRGCDHQDYYGSMQDFVLVDLEIIEDLAERTLESTSASAKVTADCLKQDRNILWDTKTKELLGTSNPYKGKVTLELRIFDGKPYLRTNDMPEWIELLYPEYRKPGNGW